MKRNRFPLFFAIYSIRLAYFMYVQLRIRIIQPISQSKKIKPEMKRAVEPSVDWNTIQANFRQDNE